MKRYENIPEHVLESTPQYEPLLKNRKIKRATLLETAELNGPLDVDYSVVSYTEELWSLGTKLWNLSQQYYGDPSFYWVIGIYNGKPTDAHWRIGDVVMIPYPVEAVAESLGYV